MERKPRFYYFVHPDASEAVYGGVEVFRLERRLKARILEGVSFFLSCDGVGSYVPVQFVPCRCGQHFFVRGTSFRVRLDPLDEAKALALVEHVQQHAVPRRLRLAGR